MFFNKKYKASEIGNVGIEDRKVKTVIGMLDEQSKEEPVEPPKIEEEWIWVEGYKGTNKDMKCRDYQYELNNYYTHNEKVKLCESGFHFCTKLEDVFNYYTLNRSNRFFKIKGLVKKKDYENRSSLKISYGGYGYVTIDSKLSAKEMIFLEELKFDDLKSHIQSILPFIETEKEYYNCEDYVELSKNKFLSEMSKLGFSELYSYIKYMNFKNNKDLYIFLQRVRAYQSEGISKDIMIYLLETLQQNVGTSTFQIR